MKTPQQFLVDVERRLTSTWADALTDELRATTGDDRPEPCTSDTSTSDTGAAGEPVKWPHPFPLGQPTAQELTHGFAQHVVPQVSAWREWAAQHQVPLTFRTRRVLGTDQQLPTHALVTDVDTAAQLVGGPWPQRLARGRARALLLRSYPHLDSRSRALRAVDGYSDLDFDLLQRAAAWFATGDGTGLTPRQVPIAGMHAKWLNSRQDLVRQLAGVDDLRLLPPHPARIHFTYLDPDHRAAGGRWHDSATVGDPVTLAYQPSVVIISENKDTAVHFPPRPGAVSIEGVGRGGATIASFRWVTQAPAVFYWGDMDADGLEILDGFRAAGVPAASILMDRATYEQWQPFGTNSDVRGAPLTGRPARPVPHLTAAERELYELLISDTHHRFRRVEQERIPLAVAAAAVQTTLAGRSG